MRENFAVKTLCFVVTEKEKKGRTFLSSNN
jgi:hypothetical protein